MPDTDSTSDDTTEPGGLGCSVVLALVLALVGVFTAYLLVAPLISWCLTRDWVETPCTILSASLEHDEHDSVVAEYSYEFEGKQYSNDEVSFYSGEDNIDTFYSRIGRQLEQVVASGGAFRCYVDPDEPSQSVLYRTLRPRMFVFMAAFPFTFGLLGFAGLCWCRNEHQRQQFAKTARVAAPKEPWTWRTDWESGVIAPVETGQILTGMGAVFLNAIAWPLTILFFPCGLVLSPLCVLGLYVLVETIRSRLAFHRARKARLYLDVPTGVRGGSISGRVVLPIESEPDDGFLVSLSVFHRLKRKDENNEDVTTEAARGQWQHRMMAVPEGDGIAVPFWFAISDRYKPVNEDKPIVWTIDIQPSPPHLSCSLHFEVPVFTVEDPAWASPLKPMRGERIPVTLHDCLKRNNGDVVEESPEQCVVEISPPKRWGWNKGKPRRLEYDDRNISLTESSNQLVWVRTADVVGIHRRLSGFGSYVRKEPLPFGTFRELYEVVLQMRDGQLHLVASFERLADAKALIRSMRRVTGVANTKQRKPVRNVAD